jgi:transcriptional pleiotropic regulator of transition state genes
MKATGIVRKVDELGRVVIPMELRRTLGIGDKDPLEIYVDDDRIMLKKYAPGCTLCGEMKPIAARLYNKDVCTDCATLLTVTAS